MSTNAITHSGKWVEKLCDIQASGEDICFFRVNDRRFDGSIEFQDYDLEGALYTVTGTVSCCDDIEVNRDLQSEEINLTAGGTLTYPGLTINSLSIYVLTGTLDINGVTLPTNVIRNIKGDDNKNNIVTTQVIDNVTGTAFISVARYV